MQFATSGHKFAAPTMIKCYSGDTTGDGLGSRRADSSLSADIFIAAACRIHTRADVRPGMRLRSARDTRDTSNEPALKTLISTVHYDGMLISELAARLDLFRQMQIETLLLRGTRSIGYLTAAVDALSSVLPRAPCRAFGGRPSRGRR
jgi:hypothetical protein